MSKLTVLLASLALIAAACGSSDDQEAAAVAEAPTEEVVPEPTQAPLAETAEVPDTAPALEPGSVGVGQVVIDGTSIDYAVAVPDGFEVGDQAPLLLAFPPGGQDLALTENLVAGTYAAEAQRLGWVVVSPAAPDGVRYFDGSEQLVPGLLDWVETWLEPEGGAPHVAGISNGGISSFRYAALNPDRVLSIISFPGFPRSASDNAALAQLTEVPIRMYVGENDDRWVELAEEALAAVTDLDGDVELTVFAGEGHVMSSTRDGTVIFEQLESFR